MLKKIKLVFFVKEKMYICEFSREFLYFKGHEALCL